MIGMCPFLSISKNMSVYFKCPIFLDICVDVGFLDHKQIHWLFFSENPFLIGFPNFPIIHRFSVYVQMSRNQESICFSQISQEIHWCWLWMLAELLGGAAAAGVFRLLRREEFEEDSPGDVGKSWENEANIRGTWWENLWENLWETYGKRKTYGKTHGKPMENGKPMGKPMGNHDKTQKNMGNPCFLDVFWVGKALRTLLEILESEISRFWKRIPFKHGRLSGYIANIFDKIGFGFFCWPIETDICIL